MRFLKVSVGAKSSRGSSHVIYSALTHRLVNANNGGAMIGQMGSVATSATDRIE